MSFLIRGSSDGSFSRSINLPSACTHPGMHEDRLLPEAGYVYIVAFTSSPAARAESIFAMAGSASGQ